MSPSFFAESRRVVEYRLNRRGEFSTSSQGLRGLARTEQDGLQWGQQSSAERDAVAEAARLAGPAAAVAQATLEEPLPPWLEAEAAERLAGDLQQRGVAGGAAWCEVVVQHGLQRAACGAEAEPRHGLREWLILELRAGLADGDSVWRCFAYPSLREALDAPQRVQARLQELLDALLSGPRQPCPQGWLPVVMAPGSAAGSFFHEVCGHPLEGDVLLRHGSYLSTRLGEKVAGAHLSVGDDPTRGGEAVEYAFDDEGTPARPVWLLREGRVEEPLLDRRTAQRLGRDSNGHARRVSYRSAPLPRMAHTFVEAGPTPAGELLAGISHGLYIQHLLPRHMGLLSGEFSFSVVEARLIESGQLGPRVLPGVLRGTGLDALRVLEAAGDDGRSLQSTRGCRKLDHGPLRVSFGQPTLRFEGLQIEPGP